MQTWSIWADCGLSPQERNRKGSSKKADAQGIDQFFRGASAAKVGSEPYHDLRFSNIIDVPGPMRTMEAFM
jgi:hypothetical protein